MTEFRKKEKLLLHAEQFFLLREQVITAAFAHSTGGPR